MIDPLIITSALAALVFAPMTAPTVQQRGQGPAPFQAPMQPQGTAAPAPEISGFSVVLVVGETQASGPTSGASELSPGAQRALADMREFLPYKHYRVLDSQWTSCCSPRSQARVSGRLQGLIAASSPNNALNLVPRPYAFNITAATDRPNIATRFVLSLEEPVRSGDPEKLRDFQRERQDIKGEIENLQAQIQATQRKVEVGAVSREDLLPLHNRYESMRRRLADLDQTIEEASAAIQRPIIDSSFTMTAGETVVVGTSRLGGDKALIALVTAVRKKP
jgi:hypothetical protein